jgi:hypothetical protein
MLARRVCAGGYGRLLGVVDALAHTPRLARDMLHGLGQCNAVDLDRCGQVTLGPRPIRSTATPGVPKLTDLGHRRSP